MLRQLLRDNRKPILQRWQELILDSYSEDATSFFKKENNAFANPIGHAIVQGTEAIYEGLVNDTAPQAFIDPLEYMIKIRAVQDFSPSQAVVFVHQLKSAVREELTGEIHKNGVYENWLQFESRIDSLILLAFDMYMESREKIYKIRIKEVEGRTKSWPERKKKEE